MILEIGVFQGGSLQMWKEYFGEGVKIYGIDLDPRCKKFEEEGIEIFTGSQSDRKFLREVKSKIPDIDILIDDGGHAMIQQIVTFEELYDKVKKDGVFLCEDLHTSYWLEYGGGLKRGGTFIEYAKDFIDDIHAFHHSKGRYINNKTKSMDSLHFYDSIIVIEKKQREVAPSSHKTGTPTFESKTKIDLSNKEDKKLLFKNLVLLPINYLLKKLRIKAINGDYILSSSLVIDFLKGKK